MNKIYFLFLSSAALPAVLFASCPAGYTEAATDRLVITDGLCPNGTTSIDSARILPASESNCDGKGCYSKTCVYSP
ncbi:MAG: hypothetical protein LBL21_04165 [Rickettsiales bacterium]|nr:hypothetical protein [Rickettsiales bacterium]